MKLIIQIPCLNEEETLPETIADLPKQIDGIDVIEYLIIDDGSTDRTVEVAKKCGVHHVVSLGTNKGLATAFLAGLDTALQNGADIIVNTDADNQYNGADIHKLTQPILDKQADYVIGTRPVGNIEHFSPLKKMLQRLGSSVVRLLSGLDVPDAPSGFRAISREAAYKLNVFNNYTYTLETLIQAGHSNIRTTSVDIRVNGETRPSRLFKSMYGYIKRSVATILRFFIIYRATKLLFIFAAILFLSGVGVGVRFLILNFLMDSTGHVQSVILSALLITGGFVMGVTALLTDLIYINRKLLENINSNLKRLDHKISSANQTDSDK